MKLFSSDLIRARKPLYSLFCGCKRLPFAAGVTAAFLILNLFSLPGCNGSDTPQKHTVTVNVNVLTDFIPSVLFITGNQRSLGLWDAEGLRLSRSGPSSFNVTFDTDNRNLSFKFTTGSWWQEGIDTTYSRRKNYIFDIKQDTVINLVINSWSRKTRNGYPELDADILLPGTPFLALTSPWKFSSSDSSEFALPGYNDSGWVSVQSQIDEQTEKIGWKGKGWFRFGFYIPSELKGKTVALRINHLGASRLYYNGRLFQSSGETGDAGNEYAPRQNRVWRAFTFDSTDFHLFAVRYVNLEWESTRPAGFSSGFMIYIKDADSMFSEVYENTKSNIREQLIFSLIPLILFFFHLILFSFNRDQRQNLYFALSLLGFAGITFFNYQRYIEYEPSIILLYYKLNALSIAMAIFFGLLTSFSLSYKRLPKRWIIYFSIFLTISIAGFLFPVNQTLGMINYIFFGFTAIDIIYSGLRKDRLNLGGSWIMFLGFMALFFFVVLQILIDYNVIRSFFGARMIFVYGFISLTVFMSVFISYNYALINKNLAKQLDNVNELSKKTLEQEKINSALELESRLISLENERKSKELESARQLQLSLLPLNFPGSEHLDIYAGMETASEVGGDYYDFFSKDDSGLICVTGDATGHGLKAGNMVMTVKGMLNIINPAADLGSMLSEINYAVRRMNLKQLYMSLSLIRIVGNSAEIACAGMPPVFIFRSDPGETELIVQKSMPAGGVKSFPYKSYRTGFNAGDIIVSVTDGVTELFNKEGEMLGQEKIARTIKETHLLSAEEITKHLFSLVSDWAGDAGIKDDMTVMVIKKLS